MIATLRNSGPLRAARERLGPGKLTILLALLTVYTLWSTTFLGIAIALRGLPPFLLGGMRYVAAALILAAVALALRQARPSWREAAGSALLGLFFVAVGNGALTWAQQWVATGTAALLGAIGPLFLLVAEALVPGGERPTRRGAAGVLLGFGGVALLVGPTLSAGSTGAIAGQAVLVASAAIGCVGLLVAKRVPTPGSWLWHSAVMMLSGGATLLALGAAAGEPARVVWGAVPGQAWLGLAYLVVFGSCLGFSAFSWLTQHARPALVSTISYVIPVTATLLGAVVLHEAVTPAIVMAAALIVGSVALVATGGRRTRGRDVERP